MLSGQNEARIHLDPEQLGEVVVRLQLHNGRITLHLEVAKPETEAAIQNALSRLVAALEQQGLRVEGLSTTGLAGGIQAGNSGSGGGGSQDEIGRASCRERV